MKSAELKITHYLYNTFVVESGGKKIAIDPGAMFFYWFRMTSLIPKAEWDSITHILVTHGDPDHYWHADRVAKASGAPVICNKTMVQDKQGERLMLGPRDKGVAFTTPFKKVHCLTVNETIDVEGISVTGIQATHGELTLKLGPLTKTVKPGPNERVGWGAIGFDIQFEGKRIINLGDTLLLEEAWQSIREPDVLMIPIGGKETHNTMDALEALQVVKMMKPKMVIPCHFNMPALFTKSYCPADANWFKTEVERLGVEAVILKMGESTVI